MEKPTGAEVLMPINNDFYESLDESWYTAQDHPIALLRAENVIRAPWIIKELAERLGDHLRILDVGCGGGLLSNRLAQEGHNVTGVDISESSLSVAKRYDATHSVNYLPANAYSLPFADASFDAVCATDILEHVENPALLLSEASRVLRPEGLLFFHTFNRNLLSYLLVIKGVDLFVKNAPKNMHVYHLFITPKELTALCQKVGLHVDLFVGLAPTICQSAIWKLLTTGKVAEDFRFHFTKSLATGYCGIAKKTRTQF